MAEIHIRIKCEGDGFPSLAELETRHALENALRGANVGDVVDAGGGMGVMDIYLEVDNVETAIPEAKAIVKDVGLDQRTTVEEA